MVPNTAERIGYREEGAQPPPEAGPQDAVGPEVIIEQAGCARVRQDVAVPLQETRSATLIVEDTWHA